MKITKISIIITCTPGTHVNENNKILDGATLHSIIIIYMRHSTLPRYKVSTR